MLKCLFCSLFLLGLCIVLMGVLMPIYIQDQINTSLDNLWMQKSGFSGWGELPGKLGLKVVRNFVLYNVTNPQQILQGATPILVELPDFPTQEHSLWFDWSYVDNNMQNVTVIEN